MSNQNPVGSQLQPQPYQLMSWNVLNDFDSTRYPTQSDRLSGLAKQIRSRRIPELPTILYVCEGSRVDNLMRLAQAVGLVIVDAPAPYTGTDYMMFAVSPEIAGQCKTAFLPFRRQANKSGVLSLAYAGQTIVGAHYPWRPVRDTLARNRATNDILAGLHPAMPGVVCGDLNSMAWMTARKRLMGSGLSEVHSSNKPPFPHKNYRGISFPRLAPTVSIDAIYVSSHYLVSHAEYSQTEDSDHPLLSAVLQLRA
jgi:hypothetical protein